jgi:hypothetical protein
MTKTQPKDSVRNLQRCTSSGQTRRISWYTLLAGIGLILLLIAPAHAGTLYTDGSPRLTAVIAGSNEVSPGDSVNLTIMVKNTGLNTVKLVQAGIADREEPPNTAKFLTVALLGGDAPVTIKTEPQMIGDLPGDANGTARFTVKINTGAPAGTYVLPLEYNYSYLYASYVYDNSTIQNSYQSVDGTLDILLKIKPDIAVDVVSATPVNLNAGTGGYIDLVIRNAGSDYGRKAVVKILRSGRSPILPNDSSVFIGDFAPGAVASSRYRVFVSPEAQPQVYPIDVVVMYQNSEGDYVTSRSDTVGVQVGGKVDFAIVSGPVVMNPGNKKVVAVEYRNTGAAPVYSAQARIVAVDPFTTSDDISDLGDLQPGESATATFGLTADRAATFKEYGLDSEIRYRDANNNSYVSDAVNVRITIAPAGRLTPFLSNPVYLSLGILAIIVLIFLAFRFRTNIQQRMAKK